MRLSWACKSSRLVTSYSGSVRCSRTGEGRGATQEERHRGGEKRWKDRAVDKSRRNTVKRGTLSFSGWSRFHCHHADKATVQCGGRLVATRPSCSNSRSKLGWWGVRGQKEHPLFYLPVSPGYVYSELDLTVQLLELDQLLTAEVCTSNI